MSALAVAPDFFKILAHDLRWQLISMLIVSDRRVQELVDRVGRPMNLVSYHLAQLRHIDLVHERRSSGDARDVYYSLDMERLSFLYTASGKALHPLLGQPTGEDLVQATTAPMRILFLCTHNSARSQMAEALLRHLSNGRVEAFSAGTEVHKVHPLAVAAMADLGLDIGAQHSKHLDTFEQYAFTHIITVCDRVREQCPVFPGDPEHIHWSLADPAAVTGDHKTQQRAFAATASQLRVRVRHLLPLLSTDGHRDQGSDAVID